MYCAHLVKILACLVAQKDGQEEDYDLYGDLNALQSDINNQRLLQMYEAATKENEALKTEREELLCCVAEQDLHCTALQEQLVQHGVPLPLPATPGETPMGLTPMQHERDGAMV